MKIFNRFNKSGKAKCPICKTNKNKKTVLAGIDGTEKDGIEEAKQVHLDCINLRIVELESNTQILYQKI